MVGSGVGRRRPVTACCVVLLVALTAACGSVRIDVKGNGMAPTLRDGEVAFGTRDVESIERFDIVGFRSWRDEEVSFVMRVVGLPGETIERRDGRVYVNGRPIDEPYVASGSQLLDDWGPRNVPVNHYFVLGDNRPDSSDSRRNGPVPRERVWLKVVVQ